MPSGAAAVLSTLANSYADALISVSKTVGIEVEFTKSDMINGINAPGSNLAVLIGLIGHDVHGSVAMMSDLPSFEAYVESFTCGTVKPSLDDPMSMSVLGEVTNMISGQALIKANIPDIRITPPQVLSGNNIKTMPAKADVKSLTLPFKIRDGRLYLILSVYY
ncbi:MAG: chemotaxis protein CheX [Synergistaceae bacterium]|jgi:chemotaxis protein CheX|nr:chemotaxis protein CheX [Synergistaceae bacterium]